MSRNPAKTAQQQNLLSPVAELLSPAQSPLPPPPHEMSFEGFIDDDAITVGCDSCTDDIGMLSENGSSNGTMFGGSGSVPQSEAEMGASALFGRLASDHLSSASEDGDTSESDLDLSNQNSHSFRVSQRGRSISSFTSANFIANDIPPPINLARHPSLRQQQQAPPPARRGSGAARANSRGGSMSAPPRNQFRSGGMVQASFREGSELGDLVEVIEPELKVPEATPFVADVTSAIIATNTSVQRNLGLLERNTSILSEESGDGTTEDDSLDQSNTSSDASSQNGDSQGVSDIFRSMLEMRAHSHESSTTELVPAPVEEGDC